MLDAAAVEASPDVSATATGGTGGSGGSGTTATGSGGGATSGSQTGADAAARTDGEGNTGSATGADATGSATTSGSTGAATTGSTSTTGATTGAATTGSTTGGTTTGGTTGAVTTGSTTTGTTTGGTTGSTTGSTTGGTTGTSGNDVCPYPATTAVAPILYNGATGAACDTSIPSPRKGFWFTYHDNTVDGSSPVALAGARGGCGGAGDCAIHVSGSGFTDYGAGVGFDLLDDSNGNPIDYDASTYLGVRFYVRGTLVGTRGAMYQHSDDTIHIKLVTAPPVGPDGGLLDRRGDDFGGYCTLGADPTAWYACQLAFADAKRDGFRNDVVPVATDSLDLKKLRKIQFEFSRFSGSTSGATTVLSFDVWFDNVSFY